MAPKAKAETAKPAPGEGKAAKAKAKKAAKVEEEEPKMEQPDRKEFDKATEKIQEEINALQQKQVALQEKITERSGGKDEYFQKRNEYKIQLDTLTQKIDELMKEKEGINGALGEKRQEGTEMRNKLNKMKRSIGYTNEADIDERIATIDFKLSTETMSLKQEKDFLREISELKRNRPKVGNIDSLEKDLENRDTGMNLRENIVTVNEKMATYRDAKKSVSLKLKELNESRTEQLGDLPILIKEKEELVKEIRGKQDERNKLRDEFRGLEREYNQWKADQRKAKQNRMHEEMAAREAQWKLERLKKKAESMDQQPYVSEMTLVEQTILFLKNLTQDKGPVEKKEEKEITHNNPEGTEVMIKKEDRDEFYYAPTAHKKKGKKAKVAKEGSAKSIKHNAETFKLFDQLKLNAPITTDDIPATLEQLEVQLQEFKDKVAAWEKHREEMKEKILSGQIDPDAEEAPQEEETKEETKEEEGETKEKADE